MLNKRLAVLLLILMILLLSISYFFEQAMYKKAKLDSNNIINEYN